MRHGRILTRTIRSIAGAKDPALLPGETIVRTGWAGSLSSMSSSSGRLILTTQRLVYIQNRPFFLRPVIFLNSLVYGKQSWEFALGAIDSVAEADNLSLWFARSGSLPAIHLKAGPRPIRIQPFEARWKESIEVQMREATRNLGARDPQEPR